MNQQLITAAYAAWCEGNVLRTRRRRFLRYTFGNQWGDMLVDNDGNSMTECEYLMRQFRQPLKGIPEGFGIAAGKICAAAGTGKQGVAGK